MDGLGAVVLAAGRGTRMSSRRPKALHSLLGRPLALWPATLAAEVGARPIVMVIGPDQDDVARTLAEHVGAPDLTFAVQAAPRGTADAVLAAREATRGWDHLLLLNADLPLLRAESLARLVQTYRERCADLLFASCKLSDGGQYGRVLRGADSEVRAIREARDASPEEMRVREVNVGAYLARRSDLFQALSEVRNDNAQGELYLTDIVAWMVARGRKVFASTLDHPGEMQGVNNRVELASAARVLCRRLLEQWMLAGVTFEDPRTTWIEPQVELARDCVVGPGVMLRGATRLATGASVGPGAVLVDTVLGEEARVGANAVLHGALVPAGAQVSPLTVRLESKG